MYELSIAVDASAKTSRSLAGVIEGKPCNVEGDQEVRMVDDEMLTYQGASELLGVKVNTLYSMVARGQLPFVRMGPRLVRFSRAALLEWVRERSVAVRGAT